MDLDPGETTDISELEPRLTAAMVRALDDWLLESAGGPSSAREGGEDFLDALRSLGYVDSPGGGH
jgi:hypothetical protein